MDWIFVARKLPDGQQVLIPRATARAHYTEIGRPKRTYKTHSEARLAKRKHQKAYRCRICRAYHIGTKKKHPKRRRSENGET